MKKYWLTLAAVTLFGSASFAQQKDTLRLSLTEAIRYAVKNNPQLKSAQLDETTNRYKIKEIKSSAFPQITGSAGGTDNYKQASQLLPGDLMGQPGTTIPVKFGTRYVYNGTVQLSQNIYNPSIITGLKAAKESQGLYELQTFQSKEDLIYNMASLYIQIQLAEKQKELYAGNIDRTEKLLDITSLQLKEGIAKKVDVEQLKVNLTNMRAQLSNAENDYEKVIDNFKLLMNIDLNQPIVITAPGESEKIALSGQLNLAANTDLNIIDKQIRLQKLNTKNIQSGYKPTLTFSANYGRQWQTEKLFDNNATTGITSGYYSLNLSIPIFDSFKKRNQVAQSKIAMKQLELSKAYTEKNIETQYRTATNNLNQNQKVFEAQTQNMKLAEDLYNVAKLSYTEGVSDLSELINAENSLREAQSQFLTAMLQTHLAELETMKASGQLSQLIKDMSNKN